MRRMMHSLRIALAAMHLLLVTLGAASVNLGDVGPLGKALDRYSVLSGAASGYGFFASGGTGQYQLFFDVLHRDGSRFTTSLATGASAEADHRVFHVAGTFAEPDEDLRRKLAASLAAAMFTRHPGAEEVVVRVVHFESVSMAEAREGRMTHTVPFYQAKFKRRGLHTEVAGHAHAHAG